MRVLVTGGAGFVGSHVVDALFQLRGDGTYRRDNSRARAESGYQAPHGYSHGHRAFV